MALRWPVGSGAAVAPFLPYLNQGSSGSSPSSQEDSGLASGWPLAVVPSPGHTLGTWGPSLPQSLLRFSGLGGLPLLPVVQTAHSRRNETTFLRPPPERLAWPTAAAAARVKWQQLVPPGRGWGVGCGRHKNGEGFFFQTMNESWVGFFFPLEAERWGGGGVSRVMSSI